MPIPPERPSDLLACIEVRRQEDGTLISHCNFHNQDAKTIVAKPGDPDLGLDDEHTVLHDAAHLLLCLLAGVGTSPVLERVAGVRPGALEDPVNGLDQTRVDLEEAAVFALHAWVQHLQENGLAGGCTDATCHHKTEEPNAQL